MLSKFYKDVGGVSALEFAFVAPFIMALFLGSVDFGNYLEHNWKIEKATNDLADVISQENEISADNIDALSTAFSAVYQNNNGIIVSSLGIDPAGIEAVVNWSYGANGQSGHVTGYVMNGNSIPLDMLKLGYTVILIELTATYDGAYYIGNSIDLTRTAIRWPRGGNLVFCNKSNVCVRG